MKFVQDNRDLRERQNRARSKRSFSRRQCNPAKETSGDDAKGSPVKIWHRCFSRNLANTVTFASLSGEHDNKRIHTLRQLARFVTFMENFRFAERTRRAQKELPSLIEIRQESQQKPKLPLFHL